MTDITNVNDTTDVDTDEPIPALLPRDWPAQLTAFLDNVYVSPAVRQAAFALVDGWVQAAADAVEEIEAEVMEELGVLTESDTGDASDA